MATPSINDLDGLLASLNDLKPPGASKGKITTITALCVSNVQAESSIVQSFYRALKKAPATHKLGALYVIDSVVRQWIEKSKASGQGLRIEGRGEPGTYPAAVKRVTELMPPLFDDILKGIPPEQKPKLENMVNIWEKGSTFPAPMIADFKAKLSGAVAVNGATQPTPQAKSSGEKFKALKPTRPLQTPLGMPPAQLYERGLVPGRTAPPAANGTSAVTNSGSAPAPAPAVIPPAPSSHVNDILAALSRAVPSAPPAAAIPASSVQQAVPPPAAAPQLPPELAALFAAQTMQSNGQPAPAPQPQYSYPGTFPPNPAYQVAPAFPGYPQAPPSIPQAYAIAPPPPPQPQQPQDPLAPLRGVLPENILNDQQKLIPALQILQQLQKDGVPADRWGPVLKAFEEQYQPPAPAYPSQAPSGRGRSRSPERGGGRGHASYGSYDGNAGRQQGGEDYDRFRQRSPMRTSTSSALAMNGMPMQPKVIRFDPDLPPEHIKVLSRTLFVGGANGTQGEIQALFERFGRVQTCIANRDKRHAFVKMTTREYALQAKDGMEELQRRADRDVMHVARQTKWGVGFGPRECCDYARGESTIPIHKLTDADMKWLLTAEYGGTGGESVKGGMVLEEPDIEIGAGVSSKAMSKRVGPETSGASGGPQKKQHRGDARGDHRHGKGRGGGGGGDHGGYGGGGSSHHGGGGGGYGAGAGQQMQGMDPHAYVRPEPVAVATPPAVPGFGFSFNLPQGGGQGGAYR